VIHYGFLKWNGVAGIEERDLPESYKEKIMRDQKHCLLRLKLVEDLAGRHVYIHTCRDCGSEYGDEFTVFHKSTGEPSDPVPLIGAQVCFGPPIRRNDLAAVDSAYRSMFEVAHG
jgi:hypothetical protein